MPSSACKKSALRSEEHTSELQSHDNVVCRLLLEKQETDPRRLTRAVRGGLAWIGVEAVGGDGGGRVVKGLEEDRRRRDETANDLAFFFLNIRAPPQFYPFPPPAPFRF